MFIMYANNSHTYTHLIIALGIVRNPTIWGLITPKYSCTHDIAGLVLTLMGDRAGRWREASRRTHTTHGGPERVRPAHTASDGTGAHADCALSPARHGILTQECAADVALPKCDTGVRLHLLRVYTKCQRAHSVLRYNRWCILLYGLPLEVSF